MATQRITKSQLKRVIQEAVKKQLREQSYAPRRSSDGRNERMTMDNDSQYLEQAEAHVQKLKQLFPNIFREILTDEDMIVQEMASDLESQAFGGERSPRLTGTNLTGYIEDWLANK